MKIEKTLLCESLTLLRMTCASERVSMFVKTLLHTFLEILVFSNMSIRMKTADNSGSFVKSFVKCRQFTFSCVNFSIFDSAIFGNFAYSLFFCLHL